MDVPAEAENIAVCIRVRPMNEREMRANDAPALACVPKLNVVSLTDPETGAPLSGKGNVFQYDQIFDAASDSRAIYECVGRRIVHSTLGGINGTVFAYGQTSSGKTFTMQGDGDMPFSESTNSHPGILQLAVEDIFNYIENCEDRDFLLRVSFLEIYNEVVKDLLNVSEKGANLKLREDPRKGVYVESKEEIITNYEDIVTLLQTGNQNRTTGQTAMNEKSSRSHSVFRIVIESKQKTDSRRLSEEDVNGAVLVASLNLVDLAGSESLRHTGAEGIRQREAGNINKSLLTLSRVINSLASSGGKGQNAPFRDSKLTRLLQNSLGGNTRTLIVCCVTPSDRFIEETKSTLQFAARAKDIKTTATVNEVLDDQTQLRRLKREVHELKKLANSEALNALKAENEALISEKNHNKAEMARLMGLILSSSSVTKENVGKKRKQRGKRSRETWGPGDFPSNIKALGSSSPNRYPRKRHSPAKENVNPQTLFSVYEDTGDTVEKEHDDPVFDLSKTKQSNLGVEASSKNVLDLFSAVFQSYRDGNCEDPIATMETIANQKSPSLGDIERVRAFEVLADIRSLIVANVQSKTAFEEKMVLEQEVKDLRSRLSTGGTSSDPMSGNCGENTAKAEALVEENTIDLRSTEEYCQELEMEKTNCQQMAAEELSVLRSQLETQKLESDESRQRFNMEKRELESALESLQSGLPQPDSEEYVNLRSQKDELESLVEQMKSSMTVLQLTVVERDEEIALLKSQETENNHTELETQVNRLEKQNTLLQHKICELQEAEQQKTQVAPGDQGDNAVVEKLSGELQEIVQELAQLQCDHEKTALEKEELRTENERIGEELDASQRQGFEMSETLIELEHKAKVLQAQLDAKIMTISQMQTKHSTEVEKLQHSIQDLTNEKEKLLVEIQELGAGEVTGTHETETVKTDATDITTGMTKGENLDVDTETQKLRLEVKQLTEKLSAVELELAETKECPHVLLKDSAEHDELKAAYNKLQTDFDNLQQLNKTGTDATLEKQDDHTEVSVSDAGQNIDPPSCSLQHQFDVLTGDYKLVKEQFENVSHERNDCVEELRAVECQLMEVSEERMKLAISIDEMEVKLREMEHVASTSSVTISTLQMQLKEAESAKATLEVSNVKLEQTVENVQNTLTALQADHAAIAEQIQHGDTVSTVGVECSTEIEKLQQRLESEAKQHEKLELDVQSYEETLSVLRQEAKDRSATIADLSEKIRTLEAELDSAALTREKKDKALAKLVDALARSEEEQHEMRLQSKQRLVAAEGKEVALEEKISALQQQLNTSSTAISMVSIPMQDEPQSELQAELQAKITTLENQLAEGRDELQKKDLAWSQKEEMTEIEITRLTTEQKQLHEQLSALRNGVEDSHREMESQAEELEKAQRSCAELLTQKEASERELEAAKTTWEEKQQDLMCQLDSIQQQFHGAQVELKEYQKNADGEIIQLRSVIDELKHSSKAREEELESQMGEQESWQNQVQSRQEALQAKCDELDDERRLLREKYAALEFQHGDVEGRLQNEIDEMSQKYAAVQKQQSTYQAKLKEMEAQLEMTENDVAQSRLELQSAANSLKASQMEVVQHHNELVEAQSSKESMEKLIEQQKARIDKLEKVKMTTDILDMFRKLKQDRHDLKVKVKELKKDLIQAERALTHTQGSHQEKKQTLPEHNDDKLMQLKEHVEDLRESLRVEKHRSADLRSEMRAALNDEREKAEHEIEEMQALVKEKLELVEKLESQLASVESALVKLRKEKSGNVSYLEKENLELHVENRELRKHLESTTLLPEKDDLMGDTGTYDASAAAAVKALNGDSIANESEVKLIANATEITSKQKDCATKAGGFLLSTTELDAIAAESQEDPKARERPECSQQ